ncbi:thiol:disulfide interchange protein DsbC [Alkalispirillum mobile]|uniref:Thiol:disulfide interchange protein n=1 Tax=Alkalispirillum mobile TaxID=85925 RepID=A0A498CDT4_9GAMM|nr:DsbC family protein [Alkalispirillum mobile]RLK50441.1 thiol:disulfide interchange protein DsbC [Alkalispirillum mobile]
MRRTLPVCLAPIVTALFALLPAQVLADSVKERVDEALKGLSPDLSADEVNETPIDGLYEVIVSGDVVYMTGDGRYLFQGELVDMSTRQSLTEQRRGQQRADRIAELGEDSLLIYPAEGETRYVVNVFTDIECPYCQRMHQEIEDYAAKGIEIRYIFMPRAGEGSSSYEQSVNVWCADDRHAALDKAKAGEDLNGATACDNPIEDHLALARELRVRGTPTMISTEGVMQQGYASPEDLLRVLEAADNGQ